MIKGHTRIELTNVNTGEKKVVEDNNTFMTNNIAEYCRTFGVANKSAIFDSDNSSIMSEDPPYKRLTGGIYLFDDEIPSGSRFAPASVNMVGNGCIRVTNSGDPSELGSFNSTESSVGMNSVTLVYDYGTSQANGEIKSVCLGSDVGGYIGYGNASGTYKISDDIPARLKDFHSSLSRSTSIRMGNWDDYSAGIIRDDYVYYIKSNAFETLSGTYSKVLHDGAFPAIYRRRVNITSVDLLSDNKSVSDFEEVFIAEGDASKGNTFDGYDAEFRYTYHRHITAINDTTFVLTTVNALNPIAPNNTKLIFHIIKLNEDSDGNFDGTITHTIKTVTNNTEYTWKGTDNNTLFPCALSDNIVVVHPTTSVTGCFIDVDSGTSIGEFTVSNYPTGTVCIKKLTDDRYLMSLNPSKMIRIIDGTAIVESCNCKETYRIMYNSNGAFLHDYNGVYPHPMYLATINNLSTPVTKTTEYTMKVIYTLTRV